MKRTISEKFEGNKDNTGVKIGQNLVKKFTKYGQNLEKQEKFQKSGQKMDKIWTKSGKTEKFQEIEGPSYLVLTCLNCDEKTLIYNKPF